jgi:hypothetical protein
MSFVATMDTKRRQVLFGSSFPSGCNDQNFWKMIQLERHFSLMNWIVWNRLKFIMEAI